MPDKFFSIVEICEVLLLRQIYPKFLQMYETIIIVIITCICWICEQKFLIILYTYQNNFFNNDFEKSLDLRTRFHEKKFFLYTTKDACWPFTRKKRKLQLEIQMVHATLFGKHEKTWAVILGSAIFLLFGGLFSHQVKSYSFMFMHKISTQVVCVKGNQLYGIFSIQYWILKKCQAFIHGIMTWYMLFHGYCHLR